MKHIKIEEWWHFRDQLDKKGIAISVVALIGAILLCFFIIQVVKNRAISYEESIKQIASNVNAQEQRRFDLIPELVKCVKAYDEHEYKVLLALANARSCNGDSISKEVQNRISIVIERYPDLKSHENYEKLMIELSNTENRILQERKAYNQEVTRYRSFVRQFPSKQLLKLTDYEIVNYERFKSL